MLCKGFLSRRYMADILQVWRKSVYNRTVFSNGIEKTTFVPILTISTSKNLRKSLTNRVIGVFHQILWRGMDVCSTILVCD